MQEKIIIFPPLRGQQSVRRIFILFCYKCNQYINLMQREVTMDVIIASLRHLFQWPKKSKGITLHKVKNYGDGISIYGLFQKMEKLSHDSPTQVYKVARQQNYTFLSQCRLCTGPVWKQGSGSFLSKLIYHSAIDVSSNTLFAWLSFRPIAWTNMSFSASYYNIIHIHSRIPHIWYWW